MQIFAMARAKDQKTMTVSLSVRLLRSLDCARKERSRSEFTRLAIAGLLAAEGVVLEKEIIQPPSREGKGGQPSHKKPVDFKEVAKRQNRKEIDEKLVVSSDHNLPNKSVGETCEIPDEVKRGVIEDEGLDLQSG